MPEEESDKKKSREFNPLWRGYLAMLLAGLINFATISSMADESYRGNWGVALHFGVVDFCFGVIVLGIEMLPLDYDIFNYSKVMDGNLEGLCLLCLTLHKIVGVAYNTQVGGIAYLALNVYFSSWLSLVATIYTLDLWSTAKDILSIQELTGLSATLKSWYIVFLASMVVTGTSINMYFIVADGNITPSDYIINTEEARIAIFGVAFGAVSTLLAVGFILTHYKIIEFCEEGGWLELGAIACLVFMWIVGTSVLTQDGGIASTIVGDQGYLVAANDPTDLIPDADLDGCTMIVQNVTYTCADWMQKQLDHATQTIEVTTVVPGSNLYLSVWTCLLASLNLTLRWKAQQALQFAQAQVTNASRQEEHKSDDEMDDFDEEEDSDEY